MKSFFKKTLPLSDFDTNKLRYGKYYIEDNEIYTASVEDLKAELKYLCNDFTITKVIYNEDTQTFKYQILLETPNGEKEVTVEKSVFTMKNLESLTSKGFSFEPDGTKEVLKYALLQEDDAEKITEYSYLGFKDNLFFGFPRDGDRCCVNRIKLEESDNFEKSELNSLLDDVPMLQLQKLTAMQIQAFYNALEAQGLSPRSVQYIHTNLKSCLKYFNKMQVLSNNQAMFATVPRQVKAKNDYYTEQEVRELLEKTKGTDIYLEILLAVGMGLRRGEVLSLTWKDVDFSKGILSINKSVSTIKAKTVVSTTKTASGERKVKIPVFVLEALRERKEKQWSDRKILNGSYNENNLVCCKSDGSYYNTGSFTTKFAKLLKKLGFRHIRYHDLRHTNATLMMSYGIPIKVMSENLGHANTGVTMDTYSHVTLKMKEEVAEKFDDELFSKIV